MQKVDSGWHHDQINKYKSEYPNYEDYTDTLLSILKKACKLYAPLAIVEARAKTIPSFAEKAVRKWPGVADPVNEFTDLCGARVITQTQYEVDRFCQFVRAHFKIDEINSNDKARELSPSQFGYLSVHYIVQLQDNVSNILGIPIPSEIGKRKAEIQIRTLLQHAWASISHDSIYKNQFKVPDNWQREMNRLAALLEEADKGFLHVVDGLELYAVNYGAYLPAEQKTRELEVLTLLHDSVKQEEKIKIALRMAAIHKASGKWPEIIKKLKPYIHQGNSNLRRELGYAICKDNIKKPGDPPFKQGQELLAKAVLLDPGDAEAHFCLAWSFEISGNSQEAEKHYAHAYDLRPLNPYYLIAFLEHKIADKKLAAGLTVLKPTLRSAIQTCRSHVDVKIELPWALFTIGKLQLLLGEPYESLSAYIHGARLCISEKSDVFKSILEQEIASLERLKTGAIKPEWAEWVRRLLILALQAMMPTNLRNDLSSLRSSKFSFKSKKQVVIVAGSCDDREHVKVDKYTDWLEEAFRDYKGYVLSGGTNCGICGVMGSVCGILPAKGVNKNFDSVGYTPKRLPKGMARAPGYDYQRRTRGSDFSPLEPLQMWIDLIASRIKPSEVRVLGIGGGKIADFEYRLALALGATVGILAESGGTASGLLEDKDWKKVKEVTKLPPDGWIVERHRLISLPPDKMTVKAFVTRPSITKLTAGDIEKFAMEIHDKVAATLRHKITDPTHEPWNKLHPMFKDSNSHQARYCETILHRAGFKFVKKKPALVKLIEFTHEEIELMAELEHGRWNVERIASGWQIGPRDPLRRISPHLLPWNELETSPKDIKKFDRDAVNDWPGILRQLGIEIQRRGRRKGGK